MLLKVGVHETLTDINAAKHLRVASVIGSESMPDMVSDDSSFATTVFLDAPDSLGHIVFKVIEEVALENSIVLE